LLNISESLAAEEESRNAASNQTSFTGDIVDTIRQSFTYKVVERMVDSQEDDMEVFLNGYQVLQELVFIKPIYQELTSPRCLDLYRTCLQSENSYSKQSIYNLLSLLVDKNRDAAKKVRAAGADSASDEEEETKEAPVTNEATRAEFLAFLSDIVATSCAKELRVPSDEEQFEDAHDYQFGKSNKPFGALRTQVVEFLATVYTSHHEAIHPAFADVDLYSSLLFYFEYQPFHNMLHQKVAEIFLLGLDRNLDPVVNHMLYQTNLIRRILETSRGLGSGDGFFATATS
jgi:hypothetical protein